MDPLCGTEPKFFFCVYARLYVKEIFLAGSVV